VGAILTLKSISLALNSIDLWLCGLQLIFFKLKGGLSNCDLYFFWWFGWLGFCQIEMFTAA